MGVPQAMQALGERAVFMRESLQKSQTITDNMVAILGSFDHRLSALETAMRPTQVALFLSPVWLTRKKKIKEKNSIAYGKKMIEKPAFTVL
jgi:predicted methyltransferase MtxX (methanogen marker protein 4)